MRTHVTPSKFFPTVPFPFALALTIVVLVLPGCQQKTEEKDLSKPAVTLDNLRTAHEKSVKRQRLYILFSARAEQERLKNLARLFKAVARSEEIHATLHADLLRKNSIEPADPEKDSVAVGTSLQTLKMAMSNEQIEGGSMYPNLIKTAEIEKYDEAASQFSNVMRADQRHGELFKEAYDEAGRIPKTPFLVCRGCGYILTSEKIQECPVCRAQKQNFEMI